MSYETTSFKERIVTARKEHLCKVCYRPIHIGAQYTYSTGLFEGEFYADSNHTACLEVGRMAIDMLGCEACGTFNEYTYDDLAENITTMFDILFPNEPHGETCEMAERVYALPEDEIVNKINKHYNET